MSLRTPFNPGGGGALSQRGGGQWEEEEGWGGRLLPLRRFGLFLKHLSCIMKCSMIHSTSPLSHPPPHSSSAPASLSSQRATHFIRQLPDSRSLVQRVKEEVDLLLGHFSECCTQLSDAVCVPLLLFFRLQAHLSSSSLACASRQCPFLLDQPGTPPRGDAFIMSHFTSALPPSRLACSSCVS